MKRPDRIATLTFEGTDYDGGKVKARFNVSFADLFELDRLQEEEGFQAVIARFVDDYLIDWNLEEDDGTKTPLTKEGLLSWPPDFFMLLLNAWRDELLSTANPLVKQSVNGALEPELNLDNLSVPN